MSAKFIIKRAKNGQFYFTLVAGNNEPVGRSEMYKQKVSAKNGIESVKKNAGEEKNYAFKQGANGKYYFSLKARNGEIILQSQGYASEASAKNGAQAVARAASSASVIDETVSS